MTRTSCTSQGLPFDRTWAVTGADGKLGSGKTTRRFRRMPDLLTMSAFVETNGSAQIRFPDGTFGAVDSEHTASKVSDIVGERVTLESERDVSHLDDGPIHLLTTASLRWLASILPAAGIDSRRFRPNLVIETEEREESWIGHLLQIGETILRVGSQTVRCVMTTQSQDELPVAPEVLSTLGSQNGTCLGVYASVETPGRVEIGDPVRLVAPAPPLYGSGKG